MLPDDIEARAEAWRERGVALTPEKAKAIYEHCMTKIRVAKIDDQDGSYLGMLFDEEVVSMASRAYVTLTSAIRENWKGGVADVFGMLA